MWSNQLDTAASLLSGRSRILVFTGAGISTESGIPDFRGPDGVWTKVDPAEFTYDRYVSNPDTRRKSWEMRFGTGALDAVPNPAHEAVVELWESGRMIGCVTQNIDGLHGKAGLPDEALVEIHGNARRVRCLQCETPVPLDEARRRWAEGEADLRCRDCGGILKSTVISFGEMMPQEAMDRAFAWAEEADAAIAVGSTLSVYPAAYVPLEVASRGEPYVIVNRGPTEHDGLATSRVEGAAGMVLPEFVKQLVG